MSMADDLHRASLLFQLFLHGLWMNTVQSANNWIRAHPLKKNKVENLKGTYFSERNTFLPSKQRSARPERRWRKRVSQKEKRNDVQEI